MLKLAIIGIGHIAKYQIKAIDHSPHIVLTDAFDIDSNANASLSKDVRFHDSFEAMLNHAVADIYLISTSNNSHFSIAMQLLERKKHILLEKPVCVNANELKLLTDAIHKSNTFFHVAYHAGFARDVQWWLHQNKDELGRLTDFNAGFFDPYIANGSLKKEASSLGGSWIDSGINALSVITQFISASDLSLHTSRMTKVDGIECAQIQGHAVFSFTSQNKTGQGIIDTNWSLGINEKSTCLWYEKGKILLDHSNESVYQLNDDGATLIKDMRNNHERLTNHYIALFEDLCHAFSLKQGNLEFTTGIHKLLFDALDVSKGHHGS
jgi:D-galactose 1-dehydrogenase